MNYDSLIIGFGKGGKTLAAALAKRGEKIALVERCPEMYGGTCINAGCIPSKSLVHSAEAVAAHQDFDFETKAKLYAAAIEEKRRVTSFLRAQNFLKLNALPEVTIYDGSAYFLSATEVEVSLNNGEIITLKAEKIFINTGAEAVIPDIPGIEGNRYIYTSKTLMDEDRLPRRLVLIGGGYIGMEFSSMYANFGSEVTVLQNGDRLLPREDRDVADEIQAIQERHGVRFEIGADIKRIEENKVIYALKGEEKSIEADAILVATGRKANTEGLDAEKAGITLTKRGAIEVDDLLRTSVPNIWALGDVNGGPQFTFISLDDYRIVFSQLNGGPVYSRSQRRNVAYSVFMDTPLARVGLSEEEAVKQGLSIRVLKLPTKAIPKAQVLQKTEGFLKAVVHAETEEVLGAALLCPEAYEIINYLKLAIDQHLKTHDLRDTIYTHPSMTEAFNELFAL